MEKIPIAFQGETGAYSEQAIDEFGLQHSIDLKAVPTKDFDALFMEILGESGLGMVPIENSTAGLVFNAMDLLLKHDLQIIGEYYLPVNHFLLGHKEENMNIEGKFVHSHPQAINQCKGYITKNSLRAQLEDDTAGSANMVSNLPDEEKYNHLAIASKGTAERYGLDIIDENIQDNKKNTTRFLVVRPSGRKSGIEGKIKSGGYFKATLSYKILPNKLWQVLGLVDRAGYKINTIHARPAIGREESTRVFNRVFYSDIGLPQTLVKKSL